jgi:hypothetical protein
MDYSVIWRRHSEAAAAEVGDEVVFLHEGEAVYYGLDGVGAFVWRQLKVPRAFGDLVQAVVSEYEVDEATCRRDLTELLEALQDKKLVQSVDS